MSKFDEDVGILSLSPVSVPSLVVNRLGTTLNGRKKCIKTKRTESHEKQEKKPLRGSEGLENTFYRPLPRMPAPFTKRKCQPSKLGCVLFLCVLCSVYDLNARTSPIPMEALARRPRLRLHTLKARYYQLAVPLYEVLKYIVMFVARASNGKEGQCTLCRAGSF